jgi:hypothetical protein
MVGFNRFIAYVNKGCRYVRYLVRRFSNTTTMKKNLKKHQQFRTKQASLLSKLAKATANLAAANRRQPQQHSSTNGWQRQPGRNTN